MTDHPKDVDENGQDHHNEDNNNNTKHHGDTDEDADKDEDDNNTHTPNEGNSGTLLSGAEAAIIELMKRQAMITNTTATTLGGGASLQQVLASSDDDRNRQGHAFWDTQPMPHTGGKDLPEGPIVPDKPLDEFRQTPYNMPTGFEWSNVDVRNDSDKQELYELLANNYVEDDDCLFRFDYSPNFLEWALTPPESSSEFLLGVRSTSSKQNKLVAFISGVPAKVQVRDQVVNMVEVNYLCVHKKLRSKRLAPVLIKEITRRVNLTGVFQAVYTAGVVLPVPVASARYHHRSLNPKKLINVGFSRLPPRMTMARLQKLYKLPPTIRTPHLRPMVPADVPGVHTLLNEYLSKFSLHVVFTQDEIAHWLLPREGVVNSYVVAMPGGEDQPSTITDLCSFYHLPSTILGRDDSLFAAYSFYNVATSVDWVDLMRDCLIFAKECGADVFNALNLMDNDEFLQDLKFGLGDGNLQYYLYNWACPSMQSKDVGIVLL